jgi:hypothetical protein
MVMGAVLVVPDQDTDCGNHPVAWVEDQGEDHLLTNPNHVCEDLLHHDGRVRSQYHELPSHLDRNTCQSFRHLISEKTALNWGIVPELAIVGHTNHMDQCVRWDY